MTRERGSQEIYSNPRITLRVAATLAEAERSFFLLVETYLRSTVTQERLSGPAAGSIYHVICYNAVVDDFASRRSARV